MNRLIALYATLLLFVSGSLYAGTGCCNLWPISRWEGAVEFLYLSPLTDTSDFALRAYTNPAYTRVENNIFSFYPGFRISADLCVCSLDTPFRIAYTRLGAQENRTLEGSGLYATQGGAGLGVIYANYTGTAISDHTFLYQRVDGLCMQEVTRCDRGNIAILGGLEYDYVGLRQHYAYALADNTASAFSHQISRFWGIGPELGTQFLYQLTSCGGRCPISFVTLLSGTVMAAHINGRAHTELMGGMSTEVIGEFEPIWKVIPAWHAKFGLQWTWNFVCCLSFFELGYEYTAYHGVVLHTDFPLSYAVMTEYQDMKVQGLYLMARVRF